MNNIIDISAVKEGNEKAFVNMYYQLNGRVFNFFMKKTRVVEMAKDLTQQCFIRLYQYRSSLSLAHPPEKQVYIIAKSVLINHLRQEGRKKVREIKYIRERFPDGKAVDPFDSRFETADYIDKLTVQLSPVRKRVILLKTKLGLSNKEIADELSISVKTVENHITKANQHLRLISSEMLLLLLICSCS
ncbi:RNA polymerase sigma factor [Flavitalea flava]